MHIYLVTVHINTTLRKWGLTAENQMHIEQEIYISSWTKILIQEFKWQQLSNRDVLILYFSSLAEEPAEHSRVKKAELMPVFVHRPGFFF